MIRHSMLFAAALLTCASAAQAGEVYAGIGLPGAMVGYAHSLSPSITVRGDFATLGSRNDTKTEDGINYAAKLKTHRVGVFGDWFFAGGFRLTGGVTFNNYQIDMSARPDGSGQITIGGSTFTPAADDRFDVQVKFPKTTPYLGIGYGHHQTERGFGFVFDLGASIGKAKVTESHSGTNLGNPAVVSQADIDRELAELRDGVGKVKAIPQLSIGFNYRF